MQVTGRQYQSQPRQPLDRPSQALNEGENGNPIFHQRKPLQKKESSNLNSLPYLSQRYHKAKNMKLNINLHTNTGRKGATRFLPQSRELLQNNSIINSLPLVHNSVKNDSSP